LLRDGWKNLPKIKHVSIPEDVHIPLDITTFRVHIPSTYTDGEVEYENEKG